MSTPVDYPDFQNITQWFGLPLANATGYAIGSGSKTEGPFTVTNYAAIVVAAAPTGGSLSISVTHTIPGGPSGLTTVDNYTVSDGGTLFQAVVLIGGEVSITFTGAASGETVDYAVVPTNTTTQSTTLSGTVSFLGSFTQAQWPPTNPSAQQGDVAILADTYGNVTFQWPLEYRPDLDSTHPWRSYNGATAVPATVDNLLDTGAAAGWDSLAAATWTYLGANNGTLAGINAQVPVAGVWDCYTEMSGASQFSAAGSLRSGVSTSSSVAPPSGQYGQVTTDVNHEGGVKSGPIQLTLTKAEVIYNWVYVPTTGNVGYGSIGYAPVKIANA